MIVIFQIMNRIYIITHIIVNCVGDMTAVYKRLILTQLPGKADPLIYTVGASVRPEGIYYKCEKHLCTASADMNRNGSKIVYRKAQSILLNSEGFNLRNRLLYKMLKVNMLKSADT